MKRSIGFTLIELLVVVAIIALLIAILLPSLAKARQTVVKTTCGTNLKGQGSAFAIYAAGNKDRLPNRVNGTWLHDQSRENMNALLGAAESSNVPPDSFRKFFYCPSNKDVNIEVAWYGLDPNNPGAASNGRAYLTYLYFNERGTTATLPQTRRSGKEPKIQTYKKMSVERGASDAELAVDELVSTMADAGDVDQPLAVSVSWAQERSNHLQGRKPSGLNALSFDGHVAWRNWSAPSTNKITPVTQGSVYFWIPDP